MFTRRVSVYAWVKPGMTFILLLAFLPRVKAAEIVATLTGTVAAGWDGFPLFNVGPPVPHVAWRRDLKDQPFTLVYRFDDSKGVDQSKGCSGSSSGIIGKGKASPGTAVLTIGAVSFTFGERFANAQAQAYRAIASGCSDSQIIFIVSEGNNPTNNAVDVRLKPASGSRSLSQNPDWRAPLNISGFDWNYSGFAISNGGFFKSAKGTFNFTTLTIARK